MKKKYLKTDENRIIHIKLKLNCKNFGTYFFQCPKCKEIYVGQTKMFLI